MNLSNFCRKFLSPANDLKAHNTDDVEIADDKNRGGCLTLSYAGVGGGFLPSPSGFSSATLRVISRGC